MLGCPPLLRRLSGLSFFFPAFDEEVTVRPTVEAALDILPSLADEVEIVIVDDGSRDSTPRLADDLAARYAQVRVVHHPTNRGVAAAMRSGFEAATKPYVFYTDGDRQFDLGELRRLVEVLDGTDVVIGYRIKRQDPAHRRIIAGVYNVLVRVLFRVGWRDVDCAFKLFRRDVFERVPLSTVRSNGAVFFPELLIALHLGGVRIREVGVQHYPRRAGRAKGAPPAVVVRAIRDLIALRIRLWRTASLATEATRR
jgi:glycosyltransferase involved in cell wall biosynthesis